MTTTKEQLARALATAQADYAERCRMGGGTPATRSPVDSALRLLAAGNTTK